MSVLFKMMYDYEFTSVKENLRVHYHKIAKHVMFWHTGKDSFELLLKNLKDEKIIVVENPDIYNAVVRQKKFDTISCGMQNFELYEMGGSRYMLTPEITGSFLLQDVIAKPININYMWLLYGAFIIVLAALFLSIAISIYPLKHLQLQIKRFGEGEMDLELASSKKDEIAEVSNEFDRAVKKMSSMMSSRAIFLRNITHELKTPIAKGQLSLEFLQESKTKEILSNIFARLTLLTREFVQIENITACDCQVKKGSYRLSDILDNAVDLLFLEPSSIEHNLDNRKIEADFELISIVFKNLIDNGIKYSSSGMPYIQKRENEISFCSRGDELEYPLEHYIQPFVKCEISTEDSFGLGLYIVYYILDKHDFGFSYSHKDGINCFTIHLQKALTLH